MAESLAAAWRSASPRIDPWILLLPLLVAGCEGPPSATRSVRQRLQADESKATAGASSQPAADLHPIATVNGASIGRRELMQILLESHGLRVLQQLILREAAAQECRRRGLSISAADIDREYDLTLQADRFDGKDPEKLTAARREQLLGEWTRSRGVSKAELAVAMHRQALLRRLCADRVTITEAMLRDEFQRVHGERVEVRHLQIPAPRFWPQIKQRLDHGEDFARIVIESSQNLVTREKAGLLPPFARNDPSVPAEFTAVAFTLNLGEVSNLFQSEGNYHALKLERKIPADAVAFHAVAETLRRHLQARLVAQRMEQLGAELLMKAALRIEDKALREEYRALLAAGEITGPALSDDRP